MASDDLKDGKARVRAELIDPLDMVLAPAKGLSGARHAEGCAQIEALLAYMGADELRALRAGVLAYAQGQWRDRWPPFQAVLNMAAALAPPPPSDSDMVRSFMRSRAGRAALADGWHVELYLTLKDGRPPGTEAAWQVLRTRARDRAAERERAEDRIRRGVARDDDARMLAWWAQVEARARALVPVDGQGAAEGEAA